MLRLRHWTAFIGIALLCLMLAGPSAGQFGKKGVPPQPGPVSTGTAAGNSSVKITEDSRYRQVINVGRDCIKDKEWKQAVEALQAVLNEPLDFYVQVYEQDAVDLKKENARWTSVKFEANNLLGSMPMAGLETYEQTYGAEAKVKLDEAKKTGDREMIADVAQRYCHTKAGVEANEIVATMYLARGQVFPAALRFEKLLQMNPDWAKTSDITLFKASLAFRRAGDGKNYSETFKRLEASLAGRPLKVGEEQISLTRLDEVLKETAITDIVNQTEWVMIGGNASRTAQAVGSPPLLDAPLWERKLFKDKIFAEEDNDQAAYDRVTAAMKRVSDQNQPVLPGFFPIASQGIMVYRSHRDVRAVALKNMDIRTEDGETIKVKPGEILWKSIALNRSLAHLMEKPATRAKVEPWLNSYQLVAGFDSFLYENTTLGSLATDHRLVYAINDLAVPPHPNMFQINFNNPNMFNPQDLRSLVIQNELCAYDLQNGKLKWDLNNEKDDDPRFKNSHFLSLPISIGGKLYVLNERLIDPNQPVPNPFGGMGTGIGGESELRLICIDPTKIVNQKPEIVGKPQILGNVMLHNRFVQDIPRRVNAVHLAFGEGILVCPTNAGEVFGIDLMTKSLMWSYPYRENPHQMIGPPIAQINPGFPRPPIGGKNVGTTTIVSKWRSAPPAIQDGKIVFTAPDADSIHCVNLRDGRPIWKRGQNKGDQYMAGVYQGRVLIVGDNRIRALDLKDGSQLWSIATNDLPSGQGVASKGIYYLPLKKGEILAVDIAKGEVKAHNRSANAGMSPGNLIFYEGMVLSQTATEVAAYPQLTARLDAAKLDSTKDPENLAKLFDYGELLLKDGQVHVAVEILLKVYNGKPAGALGTKVAERLFEGLTDLMQVDFAKASKDYLAIYELLTKVPGNGLEEQNRKAKYFRLVGQGRESQGNLVEAFQMYKEFGALPIHRDGGIASPDDPTQKVPINVWLRGRISGMLAKAKPNEREPLEAKIAEEWKAVEAKKDEGAFRSFVGMFDVPVKVGRDARVRLAETIMEKNDRNAFLEAELYLYQVTASEFRHEAQTGGRALAALAQLEEKKGTVDSMRLAAAYYRQLGREFGDAPVRGNKTGTDLINELATDKRFLPFLEDSAGGWGPVKMAARDLNAGAFNVGITGFGMQPTGDQTPFARQHRLVLDLDVFNPRVRLKDSTTGEDRWTTGLGRVDMNQQIFSYLYQQATVNQAYHPNAHFRFYHVKGHLVVCQIGVMVYCLDGDTGKELWKTQTVDNIPLGGFIQLNQVVNNDQDGTPEFIYFNQQTQQTFRVVLGRIGTAQASYVAVLGSKGLEVRDPLNGNLMWKKSDTPIQSHVFGDDQYLFLVERNANGAFGAGKVLRASDGETQLVPDFSNAYQSQVRVMGRKILSAHPDNKNYTIRLYDIISGKDVWSKNFPAGSTVLKTEDPAITGVLDPTGKMTVLDAQTGAVLMESSVTQFRITPQDVVGLKDVLLLQDSERYYVALNKPVDGNRIVGGQLLNNFHNGTRCLPVNGWFLAFHRTAGQKKVGERDLNWKKGDLAWHSQMPITNQMIVVEQFEQMPMILFTARYNEILPQGRGNQWTSATQSIQKSSGLWIYDNSRQSNGSPWFVSLQTDSKSRTVNLIGMSGAQSIQHYIDEGKGPPAYPLGAMAPREGGIQDGTSNTIVLGDPKMGFVPPNGFFPPNGIPANPFGGIRQMRVPVQPIIDLPVAPLPARR